MIFNHNNEYGQVALEPVTDLLPISEISSQHPVVASVSISLEEAEQLTLITENRQTQCGFYKSGPVYRCYVVSHETSSTGWIVRPTINYFGPMSARPELERMRPVAVL